MKKTFFIYVFILSTLLLNSEVTYSSAEEMDQLQDIDGHHELLEMQKNVETYLEENRLRLGRTNYLIVKKHKDLAKFESREYFFINPNWMRGVAQFLFGVSGLGLLAGTLDFGLLDEESRGICLTVSSAAGVLAGILTTEQAYKGTAHQVKDHFLERLKDEKRLLETKRERLTFFLQLLKWQIKQKLSDSREERERNKGILERLPDYIKMAWNTIFGDSDESGESVEGEVAREDGGGGTRPVERHWAIVRGAVFKRKIDELLQALKKDVQETHLTRKEERLLQQISEEDILSQSV